MKINPKRLTRFKQQPTNRDEIRYNCPHCGDLRGKLYANFKKGLWTCFHCGAGGSIMGRDILRGTTGELRFSGEVPHHFEWKTYARIQGSGLTYLEERSIPAEVAEVWGVRSGKGDTAGRLVIPVKQLTTRGLRTVFRVAHASSSVATPKTLQSGERQPLILTWGATSLDPLFAPDERFAKRKPQVRSAYSQRTAVLVEGAADAFRLSAVQHDDTKLHGFTSIVCLWGKHLSEDMAFYLTSLFPHFYIVLDKEDGRTKGGETNASVKIQNKLAAIATGNVTRHVWTAKEGTAGDPAELDDKQAVNLLHLALKRTGG
jgi:hypothetical protein